MKASQTPPVIDWPAVLGPLLTSSASAGQAGLPIAELPALQAATFAHVRRAVRPRAGLADALLPFDSQPVPWFPRGRFVLEPATSQPSMPPVAESTSSKWVVGQPNSVRPGAFLQYAAGDYYIQDAGSMLALALCAAKPGEWVCDTCAAPGGKATGLLEAMQGQGVLLANEVIRSRIGILSLALARTGYANHMTTNLELERLSELCGRAFDCVLVDAPCTGQTMVAQGKQSLAAFGATQIAHSSRRQHRLLSAAAELVKPTGRLVYSTCAYSYAENEQIVFDFLAQHPGWRLAPCAGLEAWQSPLAEGCYRVWPHRHGCKGAFAALLINDSRDTDRSGSHTAADSRARGGRSRWSRLDAIPSALEWMGLETAPTADSAGWGSAGWGARVQGPAQWWQTQGQLHRFHGEIPVAWIEAAVAGCAIAELQSERAGGRKAASNYKSQRWLPSFGASLLASTAASTATAVPRSELDDAQAIRYVAGEAIPAVDVAGEWCLVTWRGRRLSWGKLTQGSLKNHFPKALRQAAVVGNSPH